ncbi:MAG: SdpI family protein [Candidatus Nanoarchaeia archaeon]|nr:SdpI family protein [Candidatus Nanoarchaeia archaeon]
MNNKTKIIGCLILIALMVVFGIFLYDKLPDKVPSHFNAKGEVDGYSSRTASIIMMPILTLVLLGFFLLIPKIEVFKENLKSFIKQYYGFIIVFTLFMFILHITLLLRAIGYNINMADFITFLIALLFGYIGLIMQKFKRNFFVGIRTPWTLSNDVVWKKTHELGSKTFVINSLILLLSLFLSSGLAMWVLIVSVLLNVIILVVYSYVIYDKEIKTLKSSKPYKQS